MRRLQVTLLALLCLQSGVVMASDTALAEHPRWLSLLHFDRDGFFSKPRSAVVDDDFFLAVNGRYDPRAELSATLAALRQPPEEGELHARCRFPARALWLGQVTGEQWPQAKCPEWHEWQLENKDVEVGLIFASGYLGNPASFFGHLMLHLEKDDADQGAVLTQLLDTSMNFGADVPAEDGLAVYMAKGLFGGYEAEYSRAPFYRNTALYSEREMRDLWHYRLALPAEERKLLVAHLYEVAGKDFDYLFLNQNCASRIARTLELVVDENLTPGNAPWVTPEALVRAISEAEVQGKPLLSGVEHVPSRRLRTEWRYKALSASEQDAAMDVWPEARTLELEVDSFRRLASSRQAAVLDTLLSHAAFLKQTDEEPGLAERERQLLQARLQLPAGSELPESGAQVPLHEATPSALVRLEGVYNDELGGGSRLTLRPLQYDLLDSNATRMPNAALEIGRTEVDVGHDGLHLTKFELFQVTNLHARSVPLPILPSVAWQASTGIERSQLDCSSCLDGYATLLGGKSHRFGRHLPFAMIGGKLRSEHHQAGPAAPMARFGVLSDWSTGQRSLLQVTHVDGLKGNESRRTQWLLRHRVALSNRLDFRAGLEGDDKADEVSAGLSWYF
ncbi:MULTISPECIES: DUF4105 domain-containing protein [Halomonadaceae]|uniref:Lnb N-terminal periplasmic domain-containing protein n=1 Tax=Halomonadaceae TaxID=28256 RepID=UPI001581D5DE|nr:MULTISPECIES: DUF4105 domain-containing protein [Halomonas]MDI4636273.1 DUF4105 domain-containing protein [Halomonas sp. BMC7]NUJ60636.1 DUF4105 domain-containing protein [Halomonas taeanensis]